MSHVVYTGTSDVQEFGKADFAKAEIDQGKLSFKQGVPKEVSEEVADALTSKEGIFGDFSFEMAEAPEEEDEPEEDPEDEPEDDDNPEGIDGTGPNF